MSYGMAGCDITSALSDATFYVHYYASVRVIGSIRRLACPCLTGFKLQNHYGRDCERSTG